MRVGNQLLHLNRAKCIKDFTWWCSWTGPSCLHSTWCSGDAHFQPLDWSWTGQRSHGNSNRHLLQKWPSTIQPASFCYGTIWFLPRTHTSWWNSSYRPCPPHLVCTKSPLHTVATATKASMGCYYPQGTGPYPRQSGNWRWKERVRLWTDFVACSRVHKLIDLLFDPPFPFQRIANVSNLAKSQCLQERLLKMRGFVLWRQLLYQPQ